MNVLWRLGVFLVLVLSLGCRNEAGAPPNAASPEPSVNEAGAPPSAASPKPSATESEPSATTTEPSALSVAAASDLKFALDEVIAEFEQSHPEIDVTATYGSSGTLFSQLTNEAPFDLFLSADISYPRKLIEAGQAKPESEFMYAVGHLVVWVPNASTLDVEQLGIQVVVDPSVQKVAIANPQVAPYGRAAEAALKKLGVYEQVQDRLVLGENIAQTAQYVESGNADVGIIALSLALAPAMQDKGRYWSVPLDAYPTLEQGGVILSWTKEPAAAEAFRSYLTGGARETLKRYGFTLPGE